MSRVLWLAPTSCCTKRTSDHTHACSETLVNFGEDVFNKTLWLVSRNGPCATRRCETENPKRHAHKQRTFSWQLTVPPASTALHHFPLSSSGPNLLSVRNRSGPVAVLFRTFHYRSRIPTIIKAQTEPLWKRSKSRSCTTIFCQ